MGEMADYINEDYGPEDDSDWDLYQRIQDETAEYARQAIAGSVQTGQETRSQEGPWWDSWPVPFIAYAKDKKVRVAKLGSPRAAELTRLGFALFAGCALGCVEPRACRCGCGLPCPVGQAYADVDVCRKANFGLFHPTLDLTGLSPEWARKALRMCEEAVRAAKLGQERATVAADTPIVHKAEVKPDVRPSCRIRLDPESWDLLEAVRRGAGHRTPTECVRHLIRCERLEQIGREKMEQYYEARDKEAS